MTPVNPPVATSKVHLVIDGLERTAFTWLETFLGLMLAGNLFDSTHAGHVISNLDGIQQAAVAAIPAALAVLKSIVASLLGNRNSAAALPASLD